MTEPAEIAIRLRRAEFNRALAARDLGAIGTLLAQDAVVVTGTDSDVRVGRRAQLAVWRAVFAAAERVTYVRTPETVVLSPVEPIAMEHGRWQGLHGDAAEIFASGIYSAKWRLIADAWVIEAEVYVTLA